MSLYVLVSLAIAGCSVLGISRGPKQYDLKYKLTEGSIFSLTGSSEEHAVRDVMGNELVTNIKDIVEYDFEVKSATEEGFVLRLEYRNRAHETDDPRFQSGPDFSGLIGREVQFTLSSRGETSSFVGFGDLPVIQIPDRDASLGEVQYINELRDTFPQLPDRPISIGEGWSYTRELAETPPGGGKITITLNYQYTLLEETQQDGVDCLKLDGKYTVNVDGKLEASGMEFTVKLAGEGSELLYFAHDKGRLRLRDGSSVIEGSADSEELGISVPMRFEQKSKVEG
jgi:hypothetical protein